MCKILMNGLIKPYLPTSVWRTHSASWLLCLLVKKSICLAHLLAATSTFSLDTASNLLGRGSIHQIVSQIMT
ncbi:hypothetical protein ACHAXS_005718 [Conticribra weissflogii]